MYYIIYKTFQNTFFESVKYFLLEKNTLKKRLSKTDASYSYTRIAESRVVIDIIWKKFHKIYFHMLEGTKLVGEYAVLWI